MEKAIKILLPVAIILFTTIFVINLKPPSISYADGSKIYVFKPAGLYIDPFVAIINLFGADRITLSNSAFGSIAGNYEFNIYKPNKAPLMQCPTNEKSKTNCSTHTTKDGLEFIYFQENKSARLAAKLPPDQYVAIKSSIVLANDPIQGLIDGIRYIPAQK